MAIKIYTRTGDKGLTSLIGGSKVSKSSLRIEAYGNVDELNAHMGLLADYCNEFDDLTLTISEIQDRLFTIGSSLACDPEKETALAIPDLHAEDVKLLEIKIDEMQDILPRMTHFIMPGGAIAVSQAHVARCVCRRAERGIVNLFDQEQGDANTLIMQYLNRLSDYLFVVSRFLSHKLNKPERKWHPRLG